MFPIQKKSQNNLDLMQSFLLKRFTKLVKIDLRGSKANKITPQKFSILILSESVPKHFLTYCQDFPHQKLLRKASKLPQKCNYERIISSDLKPEVGISLNITFRKVMITNCIIKLYQFKFFD